jgi:hypothetical protein
VDQERGLMPVNIPSDMTDAIMTALPADGTDVDVTIFDEARREISKLLEVGAVSRFMNSKEILDMQNQDAVVSAVA